MRLSLFSFGFNPRPPKRTLCLMSCAPPLKDQSFNPRPPKRTLCLFCAPVTIQLSVVSIHVLRRGRYVIILQKTSRHNQLFQSTSSEEDVVSALVCKIAFVVSVSIHVLRRGRCVETAIAYREAMRMFQSTSSEEDVVSSNAISFVRV